MNRNPIVVAALIGAGGVIIAAIVGVARSPNPTAQTDGSAPAAMSESVFSPRPISADFNPSGWMGDAKERERYLSAIPSNVEIDGETKDAICFKYSLGNKGWAGVYWQHPQNNWGDAPGINLSGAREIVFFARGINGGESIEFMSGGIRDRKYVDSYRASTGKIPLRKEWTSYTINLVDKDLTNVIGGFGWSAPGRRDAPLEFCIADINWR